jgi:zinc protease
VSAPAVEVAPTPVAPAPPPAKPTVADEPFRQKPPTLPDVQPFTPRAAVRAHLANGIPVWLLEQPSYYTTVVVLAVGGVEDFPAAREDADDVVSETMADMRRNTKKYTPGSIHDREAQLQMPEPAPARYWDGVTYSFSVPGEHLADAAEVVAEVILHPTYKKDQYERFREQDARFFTDYANDSLKVSDAVLSHAVFGAHPYAYSQTAKATGAVSRADAAALHDRLFDPSRLIVIVAGSAANEGAVKALDQALGGEKARTKAPPPVAPPVRPSSSPTLVVVDKPGVTSVAVSAGYLGPSASAPDSMAAGMALTLLADDGMGRTLRLRDELNLVPWMNATQQTQRSGGILKWHARTSAKDVPRLLTEVDGMARDLAAKGPTAGELDVLHRQWTGFAVRNFQTPASAAVTYAQIFEKGLTEEEFVEKQTRMTAVTADDIRAAAARYFTRANMHVVVVGDMATLREPLLALGWGPIEIRDAAGAVVTAGRTAVAGH